jgi:hypothetical protein
MQHRVSACIVKQYASFRTSFVLDDKFCKVRSRRREISYAKYTRTSTIAAKSATGCFGFEHKESRRSMAPVSYGKNKSLPVYTYKEKKDACLKLVALPCYVD